jgi:DNA recombination protein RmuC
MNISPTSPPVIGALVALAVLLIVLAAILRRLSRLGEEATPAEQSLHLLQQQIESLRGQFTASLDRNLGDVSRRLEERLKVVGEIQSKLGVLEEASRQMITIGKDISSLQNILRAPKIRGGIGEFMLENLLSQMLPRKNFRLQHTFKSGQKVDAVILIGDHLVPVDAKFPLENFRRMMETEDEAEQKAARKVFITDVRKHVNDIADKYILPQEGTFEFAMMYIPAENVYYETIVKGEGGGSLMEYAMARRVVPVSPNSFYAYLGVIFIGLRGMHIEESAREILDRLSGLRVDLDRYREDFRKLGVHLKNASGAYDSAEKRLERVSMDLERLESPGREALPGGIPGEED